jgi:hypothetical protein
MSEAQIEPSSKWCRLCEEWKPSIAMASESGDSLLLESKREITYCTECGAKLMDKPQK